MKQRMILGLLVIVASVGNSRAEDCVPVPDIWTQSFEECANELSREQFRKLSHLTTEDRAVKCFPVCLYGKIEYFKDGQFSNEAIEVFIREHVTHSTMERHLALTVQAAETANEVEGDECDKAFKFWLLNGEEELEALQTDTYCPMDFSQEFADRFKLNEHE